MNSEKKKFRGLEIAMDNIRIEEHLLPNGQNLEGLPSKNSEYFKQFGFKVSEVFSALYEKMGCEKSEKYIPASLYFYYISPYLLNMNLSPAYVDKNAYWRLFSNVRQPDTLVHNINGKYYIPVRCNTLKTNGLIDLGGGKGEEGSDVKTGSGKGIYNQAGS